MSAEVCKLIHLPCPKCKGKMRVPVLPGQRVRCVSCGKMLRVEHQAPPPPPDPVEENVAERDGDLALSQPRRVDGSSSTTVLRESRPESAEGDTTFGDSLRKVGMLGILLGILLLPALVIGGIGLALCFGFSYDTTVSTGYGSRVHNTGLMQNRLLGVVAGLSMAAMGVMVAIAMAIVSRMGKAKP